MNKTATVLLTVAGLVLFLSFMLNGTGCMSMIRVPVPSGMMGAFGAPAAVGLDESDGITDQWKTFVTVNTRQWQNNLDRAWFLWGILSSLGNMGLESLQSLAIGGIPIGGMLVTLLGTGAGLMITKPGDRAKRRKGEEEAEAKGKALMEALFREKIKSFNAGVKLNGGTPMPTPGPVPTEDATA